MVKTPGGYNKRRGRAPGPQTDEERSAAIFTYAVKLYDKGDGRAVDWPMVAAMLFKAGFAGLDEAKGTARAAQVLRRFEAHLYDRTVGNPDDGTAYTSAQPLQPPAGPGAGPAPGPDHDMHR